MSNASVTMNQLDFVRADATVDGEATATVQVEWALPYDGKPVTLEITSNLDGKPEGGGIQLTTEEARMLARLLAEQADSAERTAEMVLGNDKEG